MLVRKTYGILGRAGWLGGGPEATAQQMQEGQELPPEMPPEMSPDMLAAFEAGMPGEHHKYLDQLIGE